MDFPNSLFDKFETVLYNGIPTKDFMVAYDITNIEDKGDFFFEYKIEGSKNIDTISYEIYGNASFYWIIIMINNIQDVFFDLPLSENELRLIAKNRVEENNESMDKFYEYYTELENENNNKRILLVVRPEYLNRFLTLLEEAI